MKRQLTPETAKAKIPVVYGELRKSLLELIDALNVLEPGGTLLDNVVITTKENDRIRIAYVATPNTR